MPSVLVVSHTGALWGAQLRLCDAAPALADLGFELTLAAPAGGKFEAAWRRAGRPFVPLRLPDHEGAKARTAAATARSVVPLVRLLAAHDAVQSHSMSAHLEVALAGRLARTPVVLDVHDVVASALGRRVLRLARSLATVTVANSTTTAGTLGAPGADVRIVHPGVDLERFSPGPPPPGLREELGGADGSILVGLLGRVDPVKGVERVVEAMATLDGDARRARLVVVGDAHRAPSGYAERLRATAEALLGSRVSFVGARPDIPEVLRALDVVVGAWRVEPFGRSVVEAQAAGLPVVAPAAGGPLEVVDDGTTGILVPLPDAARLAGALARLVTDGELRRRMGRAGRRRVAERFSQRAEVEGTAQAYAAALRRDPDDRFVSTSLDGDRRVRDS